MPKCQKCGFISISSTEGETAACPACGAIYAKVAAAIENARSRGQITVPDVPPPSPAYQIQVAGENPDLARRRQPRWRMVLWIGGGLVVSLYMLGTCSLPSTMDSSDTTKVFMCQFALKRQLHDPDSAQFEDRGAGLVTAVSGSGTGAVFKVELTFRARNAFNALRFVKGTCLSRADGGVIAAEVTPLN